jgi:hypothetical protein
MTSREKRLMILLAMIGIGGVLFAGYQLILKPYQQYKAEQAKLILDESDKNDELLRNLQKTARLKDIQKRSLPAEQDVAKREYEAAMAHILRTAGVPTGSRLSPKIRATSAKFRSSQATGNRCLPVSDTTSGCSKSICKF